MFRTTSALPVPVISTVAFAPKNHSTKNDITDHTAQYIKLYLIAFDILSYFFAPKFCDTKVEQARPTVTNGCINISASFLEAKCAAIIVSPNALIAPCIIIEPMENMEFIVAIVIPADSISLVSFLSLAKSDFVICKTGKFFFITIRQSSEAVS